MSHDADDDDDDCCGVVSGMTLLTVCVLCSLNFILPAAYTRVFYLRFAVFWF